MSIFDGKDGYIASESWNNRTLRALENRRGDLYRYDVGVKDDSTVSWVKRQLTKLSPNPDILEVGSGFGKWARALQGCYKTYTGVEPIEARVSHAMELFHPRNVSYHCSPRLQDFNLHRKFDVALSITVIQHLTMPDAIEVLKCIDRHLAMTGVALLAEGRLWDITVDEAEERYANPSTAPHMIPKPISLLKEAVPTLQWQMLDDAKFLLYK